MQCSECNQKIALSHKPGLFLAVAIVFSVPFIVSWYHSDLFFMALFGLVIFVCLCGVFTEMTDASAHVYSKHQHSGVFCKSCNKINKIRPWSF